MLCSIKYGKHCVCVFNRLLHYSNNFCIHTDLLLDIVFHLVYFPKSWFVFYLGLELFIFSINRFHFLISFWKCNITQILNLLQVMLLNYTYRYFSCERSRLNCTQIRPRFIAWWVSTILSLHTSITKTVGWCQFDTEGSGLGTFKPSQFWMARWWSQQNSIVKINFTGTDANSFKLKAWRGRKYIWITINYWIVFLINKIMARVSICFWLFLFRVS